MNAQASSRLAMRHTALRELKLLLANPDLCHGRDPFDLVYANFCDVISDVELRQGVVLTRRLLSTRKHRKDPEVMRIQLQITKLAEAA